jgi:hypothetical protein
MKIKTRELTGAALDWAVAQIESGAGPDKAEKQWRYFGRTFHPSTDWAQGGPIIERERLQVTTDKSAEWVCSIPYAVEIGGYRKYIFTCGSTPLIAAMRCYVASKLGDEVNIPEELK